MELAGGEGGLPTTGGQGLGSGSFLLLTSPHQHAGVGETNLSLSLNTRRKGQILQRAQLVTTLPPK